MRTTAIYFAMIMFLIAFSGCDVEPEVSEVPEFGKTYDLSSNTYPQAQQEIRETLDEIFLSIQEKDVERLASFHAYGPKFTEFQNGEKRVGSAENQAAEAGLLAAISGFNYNLNDLKINVFSNKFAIVTFHADFRPTIEGVEYQQVAQGTLIFVRMGNDWKIVHEHLSPLTAGEELVAQ